MCLSGIPQRSEQAARACAIALGFSIPVSVALDNVLLVLTLLFWMASLNFRKLTQIRQNPVALAALGMFALLVAGLAYGARDPGDGLHMLGKYADLAFIPVFITLFDDAKVRRQAWLALAVAMVLTLVLSCLIWAALLPRGDLFVSGQRDASVFKKSLTHNLLMAFAVFLFLYLGRSAQAGLHRRIWFTLAAVACTNVVFMSEGKTGQIVLSALVVYFVLVSLRRKAATFTLLGITLVAPLLVLGTSNPLHRAIDDWKSWRSGNVAATSTGERLEFYRNSLNIAVAHPLFGTGTGSFQKVYADHVSGSAVEATDNPHNEYLNITVQLGGVGLLMLSYLFFCEWRLAVMLPTAHETHLARGLVITLLLGCLFNSLLMDHVEGLFFAWASGVLFAGLKPPLISKAQVS